MRGISWLLITIPTKTKEEDYQIFFFITKTKHSLKLLRMLKNYIHIRFAQSLKIYVIGCFKQQRI